MLKLAGSGAAGLALAGCTGDQGTDTPSGDTETPTDGDSAGEGEETDFHFIAGQVFGTIDPAKQVDYTQALAMQNLYDELVTVDTKTFKPKQHLATEWTTEDGGNTWVFTIRDDVTFTNGDQLTAEDVAYSMKRMLKIKQGFSSFWLDTLSPENVEARDEQTVAFTFNQVYGPTLATVVQFYIVNSGVVKENAQDGDLGQEYLNNNSAGSGAYNLTNWSQGNSIQAEAYDDYWKGWPDNRFDRFRSTVVTEVSTIKNMMREGKGDMTDQYQGTETYKEMASYDNVEVPEVPQLQLFHLPMNTQKAPTDDINVRKAIAYAFDYETAVNEIIGGGAKAAGPVPRKMAGHSDNVEPLSQDLDKAKEFLDKAEYSVQEINDIGLTHVVVAGGGLQRRMGLLNQSSLSELGIELSVEPMQWAGITDAATSKDSTPHITNIFHTAKMPSPDSHTYLMYHPSSFGSYISMSWYTTDELERVLEEARATQNLDERLAKYKKAQELAVEGFPSVYVANPPYRIGKNKNVSGWKYRGVMGFDWDVQRMYREGDGRMK